MRIADTLTQLLRPRALCLHALPRESDCTYLPQLQEQLPRPLSLRLKRHSQTIKETLSRHAQHLHQPNWKKCRRMYEKTGMQRLPTSFRSPKATTRNNRLRLIHASSLPYLACQALDAASAQANALELVALTPLAQYLADLFDTPQELPYVTQASEWAHLSSTEFWQHALLSESCRFNRELAKKPENNESKYQSRGVVHMLSDKDINNPALTQLPLQHVHIYFPVGYLDVVVLPELAQPPCKMKPRPAAVSPSSIVQSENYYFVLPKAQMPDTPVLMKCTKLRYFIQKQRIKSGLSIAATSNLQSPCSRPRNWNVATKTLQLTDQWSQIQLQLSRLPKTFGHWRKRNWTWAPLHSSKQHIAGNNACRSPTSIVWGPIGFRSFRNFDFAVGTQLNWEICYTF